MWRKGDKMCLCVFFKCIFMGASQLPAGLACSDRDTPPCVTDHWRFPDMLHINAEYLVLFFFGMNVPHLQWYCRVKLKHFTRFQLFFSSSADVVKCSPSVLCLCFVGGSAVQEGGLFTGSWWLWVNLLLVFKLIRQTQGPRAKCGPPLHFVCPAGACKRF